MKKIFLFLLVLALTDIAFSQDLDISGEIKTGLLWSRFEDGLNPQNSVNEPVGIGSKDDAGSGPGRFRINVNYFNSDIHIGFKFRLNWEKWEDSSATGQAVPGWPYAFGYGKFFDDQLTMSLGKLGASPWGTGGPEKWTELEALGSYGGIRFEYEPVFVPGLNAGFVLNGFNGSLDTWGKPMTFIDILAETVIGVSYTHDLFHARAAFRFDSEVDGGRGEGWVNGKEGGELVYRLEERVIKNYLPGFRIWAMGYIKGIGTDQKNIDAGVDYLSTWNWLFIEYAPELFLAQIRLGYDPATNLNTVYVKPVFYLFPMVLFKPEIGQLIKVGASFEYKKDFGKLNDHPDANFRFIEVKPLLQINLSPNAYAAFEYSFMRKWVQWTDSYKKSDTLPLIQEQWINIRFGVTY